MKYAISAVIVVIILIALPITGLTKADVDNSHGMLIDFGYWDVKWNEMNFTDEMDGYDALKVACDMCGYELVQAEDKTVISINGQVAMKDMPWRMYRIEGSSWVLVEDPAMMNASTQKVLCWARASSADTVITPVDATDHMYLGYASNGISKKTGNNLRVVSLAPSVTETICSVGGKDYIIGTDVYSDYPYEIKEKRDKGLIASVGGYTDPSYELIVKISPDLVICDGSAGQQVSLADKLRKSGIDCCVLYDSKDVETLYTNIWMVASALGFSDNANSEISHIKRVINDVAGIAGVTRTRTMISLSTDPSPWTAGGDTYIDDIISKDGGVNVFSSMSAWFMVSKEQIHAKQPSAIIVISEVKIQSDSDYQALMDSLDTVWKETPAYQDGRIYIFSGEASDVLSRPGPRLSEAAELIAKVLNPDAFNDEIPGDILPKYICDNYRDFLKYQEE